MMKERSGLLNRPMVSATHTRPRAKKSRRGYRGGSRQLGAWLAAPALVLVLAVHFLAPLAGAWYAFTDWNGSGPAQWVGLANFKEIFQSEATRHALGNTATVTIVFVIITNVLGLMLALGLNRTVKTRIFLRSLFFLPVAMSPVAIGFIWQYIFQFDGPLNQALDAVGLQSWQRVWLADPTWAIWTVLVVMVWQYSGLAMVLYTAGLQSIPDELLEASTVDGAGVWRRFRRIVFPLLAPSFTVAAALTLIIGLRVFDQVLTLTGGGPVGASETLSTQVWTQTWINGRFGFGAALAVVLTLLVGLLTVLQTLALRRRELNNF